MKFSKKWLQKWVDIPVTIDKLAEQLVSLGLEVESITDGHIIEVAIPPNRGDCLSIYGIAREVAAFNHKKVTELVVEPVTPQIDNALTVHIAEAEACPRYMGRSIHNVNAAAPTPTWIVEVLQHAGMKSISAIVDITNYVMLELGQPMHAFDSAKIHGSINVRMAKAGERLELLDGKTIALKSSDLVIADNKQALALAGIMGGLSSAISDQTTNIFLECAYFEPIGIRLSSRDKNIYTDSSHRFERMVSPDLQARTMERVSQLLLETVGGKAGPVVVEENFKFLPQLHTINLRKARIEVLLGIAPREQEVENILTQLGMKFSYGNAVWQVKIPLSRSDLTLEVDLIEEIARFVGLANIPEIMPKITSNFKHRKESVAGKGHFKVCLRHRGYAEVITYSFIDKKFAKLFSPRHDGLEIVNPISAELSVMRPSLVPSLVKVLQYNQNRQQDRIKIFETGLRFITEKDPTESKLTHQIKTIAGLCAGNAFPEQWGLAKRPVDFFDIKGDVESILKLANLPKAKFVAAEHPILHPRQSAIVFNGDTVLGMVGMLHPQLIKELELLAPVYVFELDLVGLAAGMDIPKFRELSKFPLIRRDLNVVIADGISVKEIDAEVKAQAGELLQELNIVDLYKGKGIAEGKKSVTLGLLLQHPSRTLVDSEVNVVIDAVISSLASKFNATLRE